MLSDHLLSGQRLFFPALAFGREVSYNRGMGTNGRQTNGGKAMKTLIGLTLAVVIGSCVVALVIDLFSTVEASLHAAGL